MFSRFRLRPTFAIVVVLVITTGCTPLRQWLAQGLKVGPNYAKPPAPVAEDWIDGNDKRIRQNEADLTTWWAVFNDPVLNGLVISANNQNLTLREAGFRVLQARAAAAIARGEFFPQQQAAFGDYSHNILSKRNANTSFIPQRVFDQWNLGFGVGWELDFWGRYRRAIEAADADLDASVEGYDDVLVTLIGDIASTYAQIRTLEQELRLVQANVVLQRETLDIANARFRGGATTELDVDQAQSNLAQTEALLPQFTIQLRFATNQLCVLLGIPTEKIEAALGEGPIPLAPPDVVIGIPADLLARRPDVRQAERRVAAESARIGVADSDLYPHVSITGTVSWQAQTFNGMFDPMAFQGNVGPGFQWNVLNYGRLINRVRLQDAKFQESIAAYQNVVLNAHREVENGLVQFLQGQVRAQALERSVIASQKAVRIALAQYRGGNVDFNRVALLEQNLVEQQDQFTRARGDVARGLIEAYRAIGGGWRLRYDPARGEAIVGNVSPPLPEEDKPINLVPEIPQVIPVIPAEPLEDLPPP
jgi:NodT family efflux transporter outer membrane factor (OMF) lipoprotein